MLLEKRKRSYLSSEFSILKWETVEPVYKELLGREIQDAEEFRNWLRDWDELSAAMEEEYAWCYIKMTVNTKDEEASANYKHLITEISPKLSPLGNELNEKIHNSPFKSDLNGEAYEIWLKGIQTSIDLFREENISINTEIQQLTQKYSAICGALGVEINGQTLTMPAAGKLLQSSDRKVRKEAYDAINAVRSERKDEINELFNSLVNKRTTVAKNAGFDNFRDYKFVSLGRLDFTKQDCFNFHDSVAKVVTPLVDEILERKKEKLGLDDLRPWDVSATLPGLKQLKPFSTSEELIKGSISVFGEIDPYFGQALADMKTLGHLDLASKDGKSPGGYNYPLYESGAPFIFMNSVGTPRDLVTMMHEGGHAVHSFLTHDMELCAFKSCPSEVAELASMSMELMSLHLWDEFYTDEVELRRAKKEHLEDCIMALPWIAMVDKFQHWIYENPNHTSEEREQEWLKINAELGNHVVDWDGHEAQKANSWQKQLHIFELPFYYIEYGMAQLGAIAMWKNFKQNPEKCILDYKKALGLGYTKRVPEIYKAAGIQFNFSAEYISELMTFLKAELSRL